MTKILSEPSLHVEQDSSINLTCIASAIEQPGGKGSTSYSAETGVLWYKNDKVIPISLHYGVSNSLTSLFYSPDLVTNYIFTA